LGGCGGWAEAGDSSFPDSVGNSRYERGFRPDNDEVSLDCPGQGRDSRRIQHVDLMQRRVLADPSIAGCGMSLSHGRISS
jgi:hypothetical protein